MMDPDIVILVDQVSKKYCKSLKRSMMYGVHDIARNMLGMSSQSTHLRTDEFWAVNDLSFELRRNETLGLIGPNGSGKTTLLKMLNGIFWPDKGKISIRGKVGALIAVGAGFHPLLTGRENIYLNGAILGFTKQDIDRTFDAIVDFADIGDFLDVPVKFFSSGMFVRLGFSVAVHCEPDILLVDEILAVGDIKFRAKCYKKMDEIKNKCAIILVSHSPEMITRMCDKTLLLIEGNLISCDDPNIVQGDYFDHMAADHRSKQFASELIHNVELSGNNQQLTLCRQDNLDLTFTITHHASALQAIKFHLFVFDTNYNLVSSLRSENNGTALLLKGKESTVHVKVDNIQYAYGSYYVGVSIFKRDSIELLYNDDHVFKLTVNTDDQKSVFESGVYSPAFTMRLIE